MHIDSLVYKRLGKAPIWMGLVYNCTVPHHASGRARPTGMGENGFTVMLTISYMHTWDTALITQATVSHQSEKTETCSSTQATLVSGLVQFRFLLSHISPLGKPAPKIYDQSLENCYALACSVFPWTSVQFHLYSEVDHLVAGETVNNYSHLHKAAARLVSNIPCLYHLLWSCFCLVMACLSFKSKAKMTKV